MSHAPTNNPEPSGLPELHNETPEAVQPSREESRVQEQRDSADAVVADLMNGREVPDIAEGRVSSERAREKWTLDQMRRWLTTTRAPDGQTLESQLEGGSLDAQVEQYVRAFADGPRGFELDVSKIRFPHDAGTLARLKDGIEAGAITGLVIEAYPDAAQLEAIARNVNPGDPAAELDMMRQESVIAFLANHFQSRGGKLWESADPLERWRGLRWPRNGAPLWKAFHDRAAQKGHDIARDYLDANKARTRAYQDDHAAIYADLHDQPAVQDMLGTASGVFTNTHRDVLKTSKILNADGVTTLAHGEGLLSAITLLQHKVDTLSPAEYLALVTAVSTPADMSTYPDPKMWAWLAGIDLSYAAYAHSDLEEGLALLWINPESSRSRVRVRSVVR